jgi:hypothetical protein
MNFYGKRGDIDEARKNLSTLSEENLSDTVL